MKTETERILLERGKVARLQESRGVHIVRVKSGIVWLTGGAGDIVLRAGQRIESRGNQPLVAEALERAEIVHFAEIRNFARAPWLQLQRFFSGPRHTPAR